MQIKVIVLECAEFENMFIKVQINSFQKILS